MGSFAAVHTPLQCLNEMVLLEVGPWGGFGGDGATWPTSTGRPLSQKEK